MAQMLAGSQMHVALTVQRSQVVSILQRMTSASEAPQGSAAGVLALCAPRWPLLLPQQRPVLAARAPVAHIRYILACNGTALPA